jgi:ABC-2 type transport system ATP-binding protein
MVDPMTGNERWAVHARGLRKRYGKVVALAGVDLAVPEGSVVLLAGPNGAGKTTLLKLLLDLLPPDGGEVEVLGRNPSDRGREVRAGTGFLPEEVAFPFGRMSVQEVLGFHARFRPGWDPEYARHLASELDLRMDRPWKKLSKGEARRAQLLTALAHRPPLLLLDEPTDGLDPVVRERVLALLAAYSGRGSPSSPGVRSAGGRPVRGGGAVGRQGLRGRCPGVGGGTCLRSDPSRGGLGGRHRPRLPHRWR